MTRTVERVDVVEQAGVAYLRWDCETCGHANERPLYGRPWYCDECGQIDRGVEADAETIHARRSR